MRAIPRPWLVVLVVGSLVGGLSGCRNQDAARESPPAKVAPVGAASAASPPPAAGSSAPRHDLSVDESMGGHTLSRHVGRSDAELAQRLDRERISAASTYTDRAAAERAVAAALAVNGRKLSAWEQRSGRRPNLVLHYTDRDDRAPLGRSLFRHESASVPCDRALVVMRWDERRDRAYVLTSYPDCNR